MCLISLIPKLCENQRLYLIIMQSKDFIFEKENISLNAKLKLKTPTYHHEQGDEVSESMLNIATKRSAKKKEKRQREKETR